MGDFNDDPEQESIKILTGDTNCKLVGLPMISENKLVEGTLKYQGSWDIFDQIIVSDALTKGENGLVTENTGTIFDASFLLEEDTKYLGVKPNRTYVGFKYNGGISDHLPIFVDIYTDLKK